MYMYNVVYIQCIMYTGERSVCTYNVVYIQCTMYTGEPSICTYNVVYMRNCSQTLNAFLSFILLKIYLSRLHMSL